MSYEARARELGLEIPEVPRPVAAYVPGVVWGNLLWTSGQLPTSAGRLRYRGKVGMDLTPEDGYQAARLAALNTLAVARSLLGSLDRIERVIKVTGFVNSAPGFTAQPQVVNGASELFGSLFGDAGQHARAAVGSSELPLDAPVEIEAVFAVRP